MGSEIKQPADRRNHPRVRALYLVNYITNSDSFEKTSTKIGRTLDISSAGVRLEVYEEIVPDSDVEVEIAIGDLIFAARGRYVHSQETDSAIFIAGIQFEQPHPELVKMLGEEGGR